MSGDLTGLAQLLRRTADHHVSTAAAIGEHLHDDDAAVICDGLLRLAQQLTLAADGIEEFLVVERKAIQEQTLLDLAIEVKHSLDALEDE